MLITKEEARKFILLYQELISPRQLEGKEDIERYIKKVGCIQYDPLDKVGYNPYLVLQSRIRNFNIEHLKELLYRDRKLLDGWDKNMSIYSIEDWPYFTRYRKEAYERYSEKYSLINEILPKIRELITKNGPLSSIDLKFDKVIDWAWAPTRISRAALESMFYWGELIVHHKVGTRKFYDFTKKYVSEDILSTNDPNTAIDEYIKWHVKRRIGAIGLLWNRSSDAWLGIHWMKTKERNEAILSLKENKDILLVNIEDIEYPFYVRKEDKKILDKVLIKKDFKKSASFIAPLDNLLWDRKLIKELFDFEYTWEVYKPANQRKYGYYVLPVLYGDRFVARFEPQFNKKNNELEIINWWWEPNIVISREMLEALIEAFKEFMKYLKADKLKINNKITLNNNLKWLGNIM